MEIYVVLGDLVLECDKLEIKQKMFVGMWKYI